MCYYSYFTLFSVIRQAINTSGLYVSYRNIDHFKLRNFLDESKVHHRVFFSYFIQIYLVFFYSTDGVPPRDSTLVTEIEQLIPRYLYAIMGSLAGFGILLACSLVVFNIIHRDNV